MQPLPSVADRPQTAQIATGLCDETCSRRANEGLWRVGAGCRGDDQRGLCAGALGARVGRQADELGALFPQAPCEVVVLGLVAGGDHLFVFDVLPGERGGGAG